MSLTEHEQRLLDQIERGLRGYTGEAEPLIPSHRQVVGSVALLMAGIALGLTIIFVGLLTKVVPVSLVGFGVFVATLTFVTLPPRALRRTRSPSAKPTR